MMDKDIKAMFREKNKNILINNLKYDLEKNINSLLETIINIFNLEFDTAIRNLISINEDSGIEDNEKLITDTIGNMKLDNYEEIEKLLDIKRIALEEYIQNLVFEEECLNEYYDIVLNTTKNFKNSLNNYINQTIEENGSKFLEQLVIDNIEIGQEKLAITRMTDYLKNRLFGKLETKIHMEIMLRDNNLINKAKEGYLRYQEISSKTTDN